MNTDIQDVTYSILFLGSWLSLVIITLILGAYGIPTFTYMVTIFVSGSLYFVTQFVFYMRQAKMLFFKNVDLRKGER